MSRPLPTQKTQPVTIRSWHPDVLHDLKAMVKEDTTPESFLKAWGLLHTDNGICWCGHTDKDDRSRLKRFTDWILDDILMLKTWLPGRRTA